MASNPQHEPTMEEILASIRKIISEDSNDQAPAPATMAAPAAKVVEEDGEVLELTQEVPLEEPAKPEPVKLAAVPPAPRPVEKVEQDAVFQPIEEPAVSSSAESHDDIFSDKTRKAVDEVFARIDAEQPQQRSRMPSLSPVEGSTVEAVFERAVRKSFDPLLHQWMDSRKDELIAAVKPLIREWMDEHFPALLEGAVRNEVARVVKARGR